MLFQCFSWQETVLQKMHNVVFPLYRSKNILYLKTSSISSLRRPSLQHGTRELFIRRKAKWTGDAHQCIQLPLQLRWLLTATVNPAVWRMLLTHNCSHSPPPHIALNNIHCYEHTPFSWFHHLIDMYTKFIIQQYTCFVPWHSTAPLSRCAGGWGEGDERRAENEYE